MSEQARRFIFGICYGFLPSLDGLFTYHCKGATPIHYRHTGAEEEQRPDFGPQGFLQVGGTWTWSPDRLNWFPTSTGQMTSGVFSGHGWRLAEDNARLVAFLDSFPVRPFFRAAVFLKQGAAMVSHQSLNSSLLCDFQAALVTDIPAVQPSTSCIALDAFTVHLYFLPALHLACSDVGWSITKQYVYHLAGMGLEAWDHMQPNASDDECVKSVWKMVCATYLPRAPAHCKVGESTHYQLPCQNVCGGYLEACAVQCCDESVQCAPE
ncbi:unnamed protein product, partial [Polarella glacialis]